MNIIALGFSTHARAALEVFFSTQGRSAWEFVEDYALAEIGIVDLDGPHGRKLLADYRQRFQGPTLVLSVQDPQLSDSTWIRKPVVPAELLAALKSIDRTNPTAAPPVPVPAATIPATAAGAVPQRDSVDTGEADAPAAAPADPVDTAGLPAPAASEAPARAAHSDDRAARDPGRAAGLAVTERRRHPSYGVLDDAMYADPKLRGQFFYDPADYFQGVLKRAIDRSCKTGIPVRIKLDESGSSRHIDIFPKEHKILSDVREYFLRSLSIGKGAGDLATVETLPESEVPGGVSGDARMQNETSLLWKVALWSALGRVPVGTDPERPVRLVYWPNFTRIFIPHHAMQIAVLWSRRPTSLLETARILGIEYRYVFAFYSAAAATGAAEQVPGWKASGEVAKHAVQRGFLGRLLGYLGARD